MRASRDAYVLLEDGTRFDGEACAAATHAVGEVVFTTGMSGYQESVSDPSFAGQLIAFTYPHIGNYGVSGRAMESERVWARAVIVREACNGEDAADAERGWLDWLTDCGVPAITGVDTRALVRHIRDAGAMRGGIFEGEMAEERARALIAGTSQSPSQSSQPRSASGASSRLQASRMIAA
ncbi:MAG TPA: carbamoyl-phosphate synthase domain-containing protein, partial [Solirubrobacteraceae bacterium]